MGSIKNNILYLNLFKAFRGSMILLPVVVLFFQDLGLSITEIFLLQSIFAGAVVLLEVPTGYLGDMLRRKDGLIIGAVFALLGRIGYHFAVGFWTLAMTEVFLALAYTFYSGSDTALMYDTLIEQGRISDFKKIKGRYMAIGNYSEGIGALLSSVLVVYGFGVLTAIQIGLAVLVLVFALLLVEPHREKYDVQEAGLSHLWELVRSVKETQGLSSLILYAAFTGVSTMFRVWLGQIYFDMVGVPIVWFGLLRGLGNIFVGFSAMNAHRLEGRVSDRTILWLSPCLVLIAYMMLGLFPSIYMIIIALIFYGVRGVTGVVYQDIINKNVDSKKRATILSLQSLSFRFVFMILGPGIGLLADSQGVSIALLGAGFLSVMLCLVGWKHLRKSEILGNL